MPRGKKKQDEQVQQPEMDFTMFNKIVGGEAILNNPYWMNNLLKMQDTRPRKIKRDDIVKWIEDPASSEQSLRQLNQYFLNTSQHYKRLVDNYAKLLTFDFLIVPQNIEESDVKTPAFKKSYKKVLNFFDDYNLKDELPKIMKIIIGEDVFFGYKREENGKFYIQKLPSNYCKIVNRTEMGYSYALDFTYFLQPAVNIKDFPPEFETYFDEMKKGKSNTGTYWVLLDPDRAVCFKFDETIATIVPPLLGLFLDILEISEFKELIKSRAVLDNYMLLTQRIPMNTDKSAKVDSFLISLPDAAKYHANVKANLSQGVGLVTSPMAIEAVKLEGSQNKDSIVGTAESQFYSSSGTSQYLFASNENTSVGLNLSVKNDELFVLQMYRQFERYFNRILDSFSGKYKFKIMFPNITYYNQDAKVEQFTSTSTVGFPKSLLACSMGMSPSEFAGLTAFENGIGLVDSLKPLQTSHTIAGDSQGRPPKSDSKIKDAGVQTRDNGSNQKKKGK